MEVLPLVEPDGSLAGCALEPDDLRAQAERYRRVGEGAEPLERSPRRLAVRLRVGVELAEVERAVAIERECCPFYEIDWDPRSRELSFAVARREQEPALNAVAHALGLAER